MAMTTKVGDVVRLESREGSYGGKFTAGHIGVVTATNEMSDPLSGPQWVNLDDESGAPFWIPVTTMTMVENNAMLLEDIIDAEDSRTGDVLVAHRDNDEDNSLKAGDMYTLYIDSCGCCGRAEDEDGDPVFPQNDNFWFINLSALKREYQTDTSPVEVAVTGATADVLFFDEAVESPRPPKYDDMDNAAKGAILLAAHEGKMIQFLSNVGNFWVDDVSFNPDENFAYRVKPQELIDAEEALNAAASNVVSLREAAESANAALASAEFDHASANDTVEALKAA